MNSPLETVTGNPGDCPVCPDGTLDRRFENPYEYELTGGRPLWVESCDTCTYETTTEV